MNILFISHDASRSGAPILLRNFIKWLKVNTTHEVSILLRLGGELESDFQDLAEFDYYYSKEYNNYKTLRQRLLNRCGHYKRRLKKHHLNLVNKYEKQRFDLIFSNTVVNLDVLNTLKVLDVPMISYVRELESTIAHFGGKGLIQGLDALNEKFIADSHAVKNNLIENHSIESSKIDVVHEYVDIPEQLPSQNITKSLRQELKIPPKAFIVGASGGGLWRKGYDLFIQTAIATCSKEGNENVFFIWVGGFKADKMYEIEYDLKKSGLEKRILFVGAQKEPLNYFSLFDIFFLASREEPFGIVGMESALFETPIICFEDAGGMPEFISDKCGISVLYLNIPSVCEAIEFFKTHPEDRASYGLNAKNKVLNHHSLEIKSKELLSIIETMR
jgi:glycosyltransferase involved in cell wall biosynthesis